MRINLKEAAEFLKSCKDAVIITHQSPDGDCIGAGFALRDILAMLGIRSRVICSDDFPKRYAFMTKTGWGEDFEPLLSLWEISGKNMKTRLTFV